MFPLALGVITTNRCPLSCKHCCFECGPRRRGTIDSEKVKKALVALQRWSDVRVVAFTGGEPLLLGDRLYDMIHFARGRGVATRLVTSAFWARNPAATEAIVERLRESGLREINISTGDYHEEFVPIAHVCRAALASAHKGMKVMIVVEHHAGGKVSEKTVRRELRSQAGTNETDPPVMVIENIEVPLEVILSAGQAPPDVYDDLKGLHGCTNILSNMSITPEGEIYACCGLTMKKIPEMKVGLVDDLIAIKSARQWMDFYLGNLVHLWLSVQGPERIARIVEEETGQRIIGPGMIHRCHKCLALFTHPSTRNVLRRKAPAVKDACLVQFFQQQDFIRKVFAT